MKSSTLTCIVLLAAAPFFTHAATNAVENLTPQEVMEAALYGKKAVIEKALKAGFDVNTPNIDQRTPLMFAAFNGQTEIVKMLIKAGADIHAQDTTGTTPLMFAASNSNGKEVLRILLEAGAKIDQTDTNEHFTALMWAAAEGQLENVKLLLEKGADTTLQDKDGDTAESFATTAGHYAVVRAIKAAAKSKNNQPKKD